MRIDQSGGIVQINKISQMLEEPSCCGCERALVLLEVKFYYILNLLLHIT